MIESTMNEGAAYAIGGLIDAKCLKCPKTDDGKIAERTHEIMDLRDDGSPYHVRCSSCGHTHVYRPTESDSIKLKAEKELARKRAAEEKKLKKAKMARAGGRGIIDSFDKLAGNSKSVETPKFYSMTETYKVGDFIEHPKFGIGIVAKVRGEDKIDVAFQNNEAHTFLHKRILPVSGNN